MGVNLGKRWEAKFKECWIKTLPESFILRLTDPQAGYYGVRNTCDFICYKKPILFLVENKSTYGNTFPLSRLRQYNSLIRYKDLSGVAPGVMLWFIDHAKIVWVPITTFEKLKTEDKKSFNVKMIGDSKYESFEISSEKKKIFLESDYTEFYNWCKEKYGR